MKKLIFILLFCSNFLYSQEWMETGTIWNDLGRTITSTDSVTFSSGLITIHGAETIHFFIPVKKSLGAIRIWGIGTNIAGGISDTVLFSIAPHAGDGTATKANFTPVFQSLATLAMSSGNTGQFDVYPMSNTTLQESISSFMDLKIVGQNNSKRTIYLKIEWMQR